MGGVNNALTWGVGATEYAASSTPASPRSRCRSRSASSSTGKLRPDVHGQGPDAPHPAATTPSREDDARPRHGVHRPGRRVAVDGRARDARQHGDRVHGAKRHRARPTTRRSHWLAERAARAPTSSGCARAPSRPTPTPSTPAASTSSTSRRSSRWSPTPAIPTTASPPTRRTAPRSREIGDVKIDIAYAGSCTAGKDRRPRLLPPGAARRRSTPACRSRRASTSSSSSARARCEEFARAAGLPRDLRAGRRAPHPPRLRRLHRLRPGRLRDRASRSPSARSTATTRAAAAPASSGSPPR